MKGTDAVVASAGSVREFTIDQVHADPARVEVIYNAVDWSQLDGARIARPCRASSVCRQKCPWRGSSPA